MLVKVWNDNDYPHKEKLKGDWIEILPKAFVSMEEDDAHLLLGQYTAPVKKGDGTFDPEFFKKLRIEFTAKKKTEVNPLMFHATGKIAESIEELKALQSQHAHLMIQDNKKDQEAKETKLAELESENKQLQDRLKALESVVFSQAEEKKKTTKKE